VPQAPHDEEVCPSARPAEARSGATARRTGAVSVPVSFVSVCRRPDRLARRCPPLAGTERTVTNRARQTWKACWGQPLKSSNLLSSAPPTSPSDVRPGVPVARSRAAPSRSSAEAVWAADVRPAWADVRRIGSRVCDHGRARRPHRPWSHLIMSAPAHGGLFDYTALHVIATVDQV
jgi:hypothetical protein